jgi:hypothetical protein
MNDLVSCTNCSRLPQPKEEFLNSKDRVCKLCRKCREKAIKRESKPEVKEYRKKWLKEQDPEKIREQRLKAAHDWIKREKEKDEIGYNAKIQATRKINVNAKLYSMKKNANKRDIPWELTDENAINMFTSSCTFCGYLDLNETTNGIDRLDSTKNYSKENCVSCCSHCNIMKACYDPDTFIERCRKIGECSLKFPDIPKYDNIKTTKTKKVILDQN